MAIRSLMILALVLPTAPLQGPPASLDLVAIVRHPSAVTVVSLAPDGQVAVVGLDDGTVTLYAIDAREPAFPPLKLHEPVADLAVAPDGATLAIATADGRIRIHDVATGREVRTTPPDKEVRVLRLAYASDGRALFAARSDGRLVRLKVPLLTLEKEVAADGVLSLAVGRHVATGDGKGQVKLWNAADLSSAGSWKAHEGPVRALAAGPFLASGGADGLVKVWPAEGGALVKELKIHQEAVRSLAWCPDGRLISGGQDGITQFWKEKTFEKQQTLPNYRGFFHALAVTPDGKLLVRGGSALDFVPIATPELYVRLREYGGTIVALAGSPDGKKVATASLDRSAIVWSWENGTESRPIPLEDWATAVCFSPDSNTLAVGLGNGTIELYSPQTMRLAARWIAHEGEVVGLAYRSDGGIIASCGADGRVRLWEGPEREAASFVETAPIRSVAAGPDGNLLAVGLTSGAIRVYHMLKKSLVASAHSRPFSVESLAYSQDAALLAAGYFDGTLEILETGTWKPRSVKAGTGPSLLALDFNTAGDLLLAAYRDGRILLLEPASLREASVVAPDSPLEIFGAAFLRRDTVVATAGGDHALTLRRIRR